MESSLNILMQQLSWTEVWTLTEPLQHFDSLFFDSLCYKFAGVLGIIVLLYNPVSGRFFCQIDGFTFHLL